MLLQFVKILGRLVRTNLTLIAKLSRYDGPGMGLQGMKTIYRKLQMEELIYSRLKRLYDIVYLQLRIFPFHNRRVRSWYIFVFDDSVDQIKYSTTPTHLYHHFQNKRYAIRS